MSDAPKATPPPEYARLDETQEILKTVANEERSRAEAAESERDRLARELRRSHKRHAQAATRREEWRKRAETAERRVEEVLQGQRDLAAQAVRIRQAALGNDEKRPEDTEEIVRALRERAEKAERERDEARDCQQRGPDTGCGECIACLSGAAESAETALASARAREERLRRVVEQTAEQHVLPGMPPCRCGWCTGARDALTALAAPPSGDAAPGDPEVDLRARLARALSSLASMRAWHRLYHGKDPCALCVDADGCLSREGVSIPDDWRIPVFFRLAEPASPETSPATARGGGDVALEDARTTSILDALCLHASPDGEHHCCRTPGHAGEHVSVSGAGSLLARWPASAPETSPASRSAESEEKP
jgi:hypothetical protein